MLSLPNWLRGRRSVVVGTREELGRDPKYDRICLPKGGHVWITASAMGEDCFCVRCWHDISMIGFLCHGDPVAEDVRAMLLDGWVWVPRKSTYGHGMTPCWSPKREWFTQENQNDVVSMREFMALKGVSAVMPH